MIKEFEPVLDQIKDDKRRQTMNDLLDKIATDFPELEPVVKWKQAMFVTHGTFIIGFSFAKDHFNVAVEDSAYQKYHAEIQAAGYQTLKMLFQIKWDQKIDYSLLKEIIKFNIETKKDINSFWKPEKK